jgi:hypothetical protein
VESDVVGAAASITTGSIVTLLGRENLQMRNALEAAKHALVTCHGLWALDGPVHSEMFQLNYLKTIEKIEEALGDAR